MLITCADGDKLVELLKDKGIKATIIGKITKDGGYLIQDDEKIAVSPPERDELFVMTEKLN
jgi:hydrogenase expression/formation protein HypE